ncbi:hypothetical protein HPB48_000862 [Haemaphysalis longicornis]|uniref:Uncharacterized protein n=1 Tax=Haemaphysalis longicornis TaxID=44386 RepID=A0A9J6G8B1_HAELO|nr:hypothetical protein HPB48_000862 [Haemaphysalis longicornis]
MLNRQAISVFLEAILPGKINEVRINHRKNILAIDIEQRDVDETLPHIQMLGQINVRAYVSAGQSTFFVSY